MKTSPRPELRQPVLALAAKLAEAPEAVPLTDLAALFGADEAVLARVRSRGDIRFRGDVFSNDGPDLCVPAGKVELEIPSLLRGNWSAGEGGFRLTFPMADFTVRAELPTISLPSAKASAGRYGTGVSANAFQ